MNLKCVKINPTQMWKTCVMKIIKHLKKKENKKEIGKTLEAGETFHLPGSAGQHHQNGQSNTQIQ